MAGRTKPFSAFEFMIAWRYLRARRAEGGVSVMTWISLVGIALGVMALVATLAVRAGFRAEMVDTILGANAHVTMYSAPHQDAEGVMIRTVDDYQALAEKVRAVPGVVRAVPVVRGQAMISFGDRSNVAEVYGITLDDLKAIPRVASSPDAYGDIETFDKGIAIGSGIARDLGVGPGDKIKVIVFNEETLSGEFSVGTDGSISLPLIGEVVAKGKAPRDLALEVQGRLADGYLREPKVSIEISTYRPFFILGEVKAPGQYPYASGLTVMNAIATAQGFTPRADKKNAYIRAAGANEEQGMKLTPDLRVRPGDTIRVGERYF